MIRMAVYTSVGFAAGYSLMRAIEARALGIPLLQAFQLNTRVLLTPVSRLQTAPVITRRINSSGEVLTPEVVR